MMNTYGDSTRVLPHFTSKYYDALVVSWENNSEEKFGDACNRLAAENIELAALLQDIAEASDIDVNIFIAGAVYAYQFLSMAAEVEELEKSN